MSYEYRVGDKVKSRYGAQYEIIDVATVTNIRRYGNLKHYRLRPIDTGVLDNPIWIDGRTLYSNYSSCSAAVRILFDRGSEATSPSYSVKDNKFKVGGLGGD